MITERDEIRRKRIESFVEDAVVPFRDLFGIEYATETGGADDLGLLKTVKIRLKVYKGAFNAGITYPLNQCHVGINLKESDEELNCAIGVISSHLTDMTYGFNIPLEDTPLYMSTDNFVLKKVVNWRLKNGT